MPAWLRDAVVVDLETLPIADRPDYPPIPVGVAIRRSGLKRYFAFGHPAANNCTYEEARAALAVEWESGRPILGHNVGKFDHDVVVKHFGFKPLPWKRIHDTLPALFLLDPRAPDYKLKPSAERLLKRKPDEQDAVNDWLIEHQPVPGKKLSKKQGDNYAGAYIAFAPGDIVGPYAIGDVDRTFDLAAYAFKQIEKRGMLEPYDRERRLFPVLREMEEQGVRVDMAKLEAEVTLYERHLVKLEEWIRRRLKANEDLNLDSGAQLAAALVRAGFATERDLGLTATGKVQTNKAALDGAVSDPQILAVLRYRGALGTCLEVFMRPWLATARTSGGRIFTTWHSTRNDHGDTGAGARTGRLSSTPNLQNIPKRFKPLFAQLASADEAKDAKAKGKPLPLVPWRDFPQLPRVRAYVAPYERGWVLLDRDASQQELRILGHFEDGALCDAYRADPWIDVHDKAQALIQEHTGTLYERGKVKVTGFGLIYGMGVGKLALATGSTVEEAKELKEAYLASLPGIKTLNASLKARARAEQPIRTWGGREYYCEDPKWIDGQLRDFAYKLLNILIQGSAADHTKEAMLRYHASKPKHHRLLLTVHDEILISVPRAERHAAMDQLRDAMESVPFDVPMKSEGKWSDKSWGELQVYDAKGVRHAR